MTNVFVRIEFQHRRSPHAHILLWFDNAPAEVLAEEMQLTMRMVTDLCSVDKDGLVDPEIIKN